MAIVFPASPSNNDTFTVGSITYTFDGSKWIGLGVTPTDRLIEGSNSLEINASNNLVWTGNNVGIGTNNPQQLLDVASTAPNIRLTDTVDGHSEIDGNAAELKFNADKGNTKANSKITFFVDNSEKLCITSDGKIGVNQDTPIAIFHAKSGANDGSLVSTFEGATNNKLNIRFDTFGPVLDVTAGDPLVFEIGGDEKLRIDSDGHLQIRREGVAGVSGTDTRHVRYVVQQSNGQEAIVGSVFGQGKSSWGGDLVFASKQATGDPSTGLTERLRIKSDGSLVHKGDTTSNADNTDGDSGNSSGYPARGVSFNKNLSVSNSVYFGQGMNMVSHTKSVTLDGSADHNMIRISNREGCFIGHIYAGYSVGGEGAVAMYKFNTLYSVNSITAEQGPAQRSGSHTISADIVSSGDNHIIRVSGNGGTYDVTVGVVFLSASATGAHHYGVQYY